MEREYALPAALMALTVYAITLGLGHTSALDFPLHTRITGSVIASAVNRLTKAAMAIAIGTRALGARVAALLVAAASAGLLATWPVLPPR